MKRLAMVHDWIDSAGGAENVCEAMLDEMKPEAFYCLLAEPSAPLAKKYREILNTSWIQRIPFAFKLHRFLLALYPHAIESFDLREFDTVLSSSHCVAKGCLTRADQLHISYLHTPARYLWDQYFDYLDWNNVRGLKRWYVDHVFHKMRQWDVISSNRVDLFLANSLHVSKRIWKTYKRPSIVLHPFVELDKFHFHSNRQIGNYFVVLSRLVSQKRVDLAIEASNTADVQLKIIGDGPLRKALENRAGRNVEFLGRLPSSEMATVIANSRALVFPQEEDFGIVPLECQALGVPVVAYNCGGAKETVVEGRTGEFFNGQNAYDLAKLLKAFNPEKYDPQDCRDNAERFSKEIFQSKLRKIVELASEVFEADNHFNDGSFISNWNSGENLEEVKWKKSV